MPKVLVLKVQGRHVERKFSHFLAKFWPEKITSRDGCFLPRKGVALHGGVAATVAGVALHCATKAPALYQNPAVILVRQGPLGNSLSEQRFD